MALDLSQFRQTYLDESLEGLEQMESGLLDMTPGENDAELVNDIFRAAHSIKGGAGTFGFDDVAKIMHVVETFLDRMRSGECQPTSDQIDLLLKTIDSVGELFAAAREETECDTVDVDQVVKKLEELLAAEATSHGVDAEAASGADDAAEEEAGDADESGGWRIKFKPHDHLLETGNEPLLMLRALEELGAANVDCQPDLPSWEELAPEKCHLGWEIELKAEIDRRQIDEVFEWVEDDCDIVIERIEASAPAPVAATDPQPAGDAPQENAKAGESKGGETKSAKRTPESGSIRVGIEKVDELINMVGELVITQSMLGQIGQDFDMAKLERLREGLGQLERNTRELQESVMRIRMVPMSFVFGRFPRLVRDLSSKLEKKINLSISGESTELDKTVMERMHDPLVHLVRNSIDHGIERPDERVASGKEETGTVFLNAYHHGGNIVVEISDDGRGLNHEKILAKAKERGIVGESEQLSEEAIAELIFAPGFSTAAEITDVSGRGVGMDVVKRNIDAVGGNISVTSEQGSGTTISIRLPLTLAILDGQTISVGAEKYILPLNSIIETIQVKGEDVSNPVVGGEVFKLRNEFLRLLRLSDIFGIHGRAADIDDGLIVVVEGAGQKVGLFVDELLAQQQIVIKSLETNYKKVAGLSGATILGDGRVALILDVAGLLRMDATANQGSKETAVVTAPGGNE